jgi:hypothetical protein
MKHAVRLLAAAGSLAILFNGAAAQAATRTFVSAHGADTNPCSATSPCRTFAFALTQTAPGGEIYVLDTAGYGPVTITQAVSIVNQTSTAAITASGGGVAVTVNAGANDKIVLRGMTIVGGGSGSYGIVFNSGASLTVEDCTISQFSFAGIQFAPTNPSRLYVSNTRVASNAQVGINVVPQVTSGSGSVNASFVHVEATDDNQAGIFVDGRSSVAGIAVQATIADSLISDNTVAGIHTISAAGAFAPVTVMVRNTTVANTAQFGLVAENNSTLYFGHSTITGNGQALITTGSGVLQSYGDNNIDGNGSLGSSPTGVTLR